MVVIRRRELDQPKSFNALLSIHIQQMKQRTGRLQQLELAESPRRNIELLNHAAQLCEMSRDLLYRLNRVSIDEAQEVIEAFRESVVALDNFHVDDPDSADALKSYVLHIRRRIELLEEEVHVIVGHSCQD